MMMMMNSHFFINADEQLFRGTFRTAKPLICLYFTHYHPNHKHQNFLINVQYVSKAKLKEIPTHPLVMDYNGIVEFNGEWI